MRTIDPVQLRDVLYEEVRLAWRKLRRLRPADDFYAFGLFTTDVASYLSITASTEQGLDEAVADYAARKQKSRETLRASLRWIPADSPLHVKGDGVLPKSQAVRDLGPAPYECTEEESDAAIDTVFTAFTSAMQQLDQEGEFGRGVSGERLILGIWWGDQGDDERAALAAPMNSPSAIARFRQEKERAWRGG